MTNPYIEENTIRFIYIMRQQVPTHIKEEVIRKWLSGEQRDKIASDISMGAGTVTNIISKWKEETGIPTADTLRILATEFKRLNINASQCAKGFKLLNIINNLGAQEEENIESFLTQIYKLCTSKNIPPETIVNISQQIVTLGETIPFSQIPEYMQQKIEEKHRLEQEIKTLRETKLSAQNECDEALRSSSITIDTLHEYMRLRECLLEEYGLSIDEEGEEEGDLPKIINVISNLKHSGYDAKTITKKLSNINNLQTSEKELQSQVDGLEVRLKGAEQEYSIAEEKLASSKQALGVYNELQNMGFGLKELELLKSIVTEISKSNNIINPYHAFEKFFDDIKDQYDTKLGFERKIKEMNNSLFQAQQQHHYISLEYSQMKDTNDKLAELLAFGVIQEEIIYWTSMLKDHKVEMSSLHEDLVKYRTITCAYNNIAAKVDSLTSEYNALTKKIEGLREEQRKISNDIEFQFGMCTKAIETFLNNLDSHINEVLKTSIQTIKNIKEQSLVISEQSKIGLQFVNTEVNKQLEIFQMIGASAEFSPLIKAARGEIVDINELRTSVIRALGIMTSRLDNIMYKEAKDKIDKAINILQSEWLFS
jgi:outer membrane murein-binding lipoprotein Lpp